jgi:hypothetical protein
MRWRFCLSGLVVFSAAAHPALCDDRAAEVIEIVDAGDEFPLILGLGEFDDGGGFIQFAEDGTQIVQNEAEEGEAKTPKLSEEDEKALTDLIRKAARTRRSEFKKDLEKAVKDLADSADLGDARKDKLEALIPNVTEAAVAAWEKKAREWMMTYVVQAGGNAAVIRDWKPETLSNDRNSNFAAVAADQTPEWKAGLKDILSEGQLRVVEEGEKARIDKVRKEMGDYLNASETYAGTLFTGQMDTALGRIERFGGVDEERRKKLKKAADEAVKTTTAEWRTRAENQLLAMDEEARDQMAKNGGFMGVAVTDKANQAEEQKVWREAVAQLLTDAERKLISESRAAVRARRADALAMVLVADLDRLIGLSEEQRNAITKLAGKRMLALPSQYFDPPENNGYYSLDIGQMMQKLGSIKDKILPLLGERQVKRWESLAPDQLSRSGYVRERMDPGKLPPPEEMDEFEVERVVSQFLHREAKRMKQKLLTVMEARVDSVTKVANPPPDAVAVLNTAAKGAAEQMAQASIINLTGYVRGQFQNVKPADVPARLQNLYNPYFSERQVQPDPERWTSAVNRLLTESQRKAWKAECDARDAWRLRGLTDMVVTEIEKRFALTPEQREAVRKKMESVIKEYDPDFTQFFSFGWHLQGYYSMIPMAMLSEKEMEELFGKQLAESVKEKCLGNASQYADMIRRQHSSRTKR